MSRRIEPTRAAVWAAWRYDKFEGRVHGAVVDFVRGHWRCTIGQRWRQWQMWYPGDAAGLARAQKQRRVAEALR